jgi:hypothetical protein
VNKNIRKKLAKRKRKIEKRTQKRNWDNQSKPMMAGRNICYDVDGRQSLMEVSEPFISWRPKLV